MIDNRVKQYICVRANMDNKIIPIDYMQTLSYYQKLAEENGYQLYFKHTSFLKDENMNCNATFFNFPIIATPEWAYQLIWKDPMIEQVFLETLGHEISHKIKNLNGFPFSKTGTFYAYINEIHCDFYASVMFFHSKRQPLVNALSYKYKRNPQDKRTYSHPSFGLRLKAVTDYNFTETLIRFIAKEIGYKNEEKIKYAISYFPEIILH